MKDLLSVIIPCRNEKINIDGLLNDIKSQETGFEIEIIRIDNIKIPGKARNIGAKKANGIFLIFFDSDIRLAGKTLVNNLVTVITENKKIGAVCASIRIPLKASNFQKRYAKEIPHAEFQVTDDLIDIGTIPAACFAIDKKLFIDTGCFNAKLIRGEDSEFSFRLKKAGYRTVLAPRTICYHPMPDNVLQFIKTQVRNGMGVSFVDIFYPDLNIDIHPYDINFMPERKTFPARIMRFTVSTINALFYLRFLLILSKLFYLTGYIYGFIKFKILRQTEI